MTSCVAPSDVIGSTDPALLNLLRYVIKFHRTIGSLYCKCAVSNYNVPRRMSISKYDSMTPRTFGLEAVSFTFSSINLSSYTEPTAVPYDRSSHNQHQSL